MRLVYIIGLFVLMGSPGFSMADGLMDALAGKKQPPASSAPVSQPSPPQPPQPASVAAPKPASAPVATAPAKEASPVKKPVDPPAADSPKSTLLSTPTTVPVESDRLLGLIKNKQVEALRADVEEERKRRRAAESWDPQSMMQGQGAGSAWKPITVYAIEIRGKIRRALIAYGTKSAAWYTVGGRGSVKIASISEDTVIGRYQNAERRWEDFQGSVYDVVAYPAAIYPGNAGGAVPAQPSMMQQPAYPAR